MTDGRVNSGRKKLPPDQKKRQVCLNIKQYIIDKHMGVDNIKEFIYKKIGQK